jgi:C4-dicarboxylate-specific signal transduction histidine kinase
VAVEKKRRIKRNKKEIAGERPSASNEEELQKAHDELEMRVQERTRELADVNRMLQAEISEHTQDRETINAER